MKVENAVNSAAEIFIDRVFCILNISKNSSCNWIDRTNNRQRDIQVRLKICKRKNMLFKIVISSMPSKRYERMMIRKNEQLILVPGNYFLECAQQFCLGAVFTARSDCRLIEFVQPPLTVDHHQGNFI